MTTKRRKLVMAIVSLRGTGRSRLGPRGLRLLAKVREMAGRGENS